MRISSRGVAIEVDDQGPASAEPLLLIMGLGMQLTAWPDELVQALIARGFRVIRFDNRDAGLSQSFDALGAPNLAWAAMRWWLHLSIRPAYTIAEMAVDAVGVLDALGLPAAHVCGASMGGMVAQHLGSDHAQRVRSLALMMTSSGSRRLPQARPEVRHLLMRRPASRSVDDLAAHLEAILRAIGSPAYPPDPDRLHRMVLASVRRAWRPAGTARQMVAVVADGDRSARLGRIAAPTVVIHGDADPLVPVAAAHDLASKIPGAELDVVPGMGHDLPMPLLPRFADAIAENARRVVVA